MNQHQLKTRIDFLKAMNLIIQTINDERAYYEHWAYIIPDGCDESELVDIATDPESDEIFADACKCFTRCVRNYASESGFCLPSFDDPYAEYGSVPYDGYSIGDDDDDELI